MGVEVEVAKQVLAGDIPWLDWFVALLMVIGTGLFAYLVKRGSHLTTVISDFVEDSVAKLVAIIEIVIETRDMHKIKDPNSTFQVGAVLDLQTEILALNKESARQQQRNEHLLMTSFEVLIVLVAAAPEVDKAAVRDLDTKLRKDLMNV